MNEGLAVRFYARELAVARDIKISILCERHIPRFDAGMDQSKARTVGVKDVHPARACRKNAAVAVHFQSVGVANHAGLVQGGGVRKLPRRIGDHGARLVQLEHHPVRVRLVAVRDVQLAPVR